MNRPPLAIHRRTAAQSTLAEYVWNTRVSARLSLAYPPDCLWRNRASFCRVARLLSIPKAQWNRELDYRLIRNPGHPHNRIAVPSLMNGLRHLSCSAAMATNWIRRGRPDSPAHHAASPPADQGSVRSQISRSSVVRPDVTRHAGELGLYIGWQ